MKRWIFIGIISLLFASQVAAQSTTTNLGITKPQVGQAQPATTIATGFDQFDAAVAGRLSKSVAGGTDVTLTTTEARNQILEFTGTLTGNINVIVPTNNRTYLVYNNTSGAFTLTVKTSGGTGVAVEQGTRIWVYCDATNVVAATVPGAGSITVKEVDGTPTATGVSTVRVSNGTLTDDGSGQVTITTGGGGGGTIGSGTFASRPAAGTSGNVYLPTDAYSLYRDDGSNWIAWGPLYPFTKPPASGSWTWVNQGTATVSDVADTLVLALPGASSNEFRILKKAAPSTPYTITMGFLHNSFGADAQMGFIWRQSSDGKLERIAVTNSSNILQFLPRDMTGPSSPTITSISGIGGDKGIFGAHVIWIQVSDNGTNRIFRWSNDGVNWLQYFSISRTQYLTADEVGIYITNAVSSQPSSLVLLSWKEN